MIKKQKGITLIALIITVIILLIIAGTAIGIAINGGSLFGKADEARNSWNIGVQEEENSINKYLNYLGMIVTKVTDENPGILEGEGTESSPWTINSIEDLVALAYGVNSGTQYMSGNVKLGQTLDFNNNDSYCDPESKYIKDSNNYGYVTNESGTAIKELLTDRSGIGFIPIGISNNMFTGKVDGGGNILYNLYENRDTSNYGLFGRAVISEIKDLGIENCYITTNSTYYYCGSLIGTNEVDLTVTNCHCTGNVYAWSDVGGLVGKCNGSAKFKKCYNQADIIKSTYGYRKGGIIGAVANELEIEECYNTGNIYGGDSGGLVGQCGKDAIIDRSYNTGNVISNDDYYVGGIVGIVRGDITVTITNSYNTGNIEAGGNVSVSPAGGIIGIAMFGPVTNIYNCYNTGNISSVSRTGGIIGSGSSGSSGMGNIKNCYNTGTITAKRQRYGYHGGIIGSVNSNYIENCYNLGTINSSVAFDSSDYVGGIVAGGGATNCHNSGNIVKGNSNYAGEIMGYVSNLATSDNCTYLHRSSNVAANGATEVTTEDSSFSNAMTTLLNNMNSFVNSYNASSNIKLKTWVIGSNGYPVWSN